ncbi:MAG: CBS domain-containing protein [Hyphomicrobiales bacterium]
MTVSHILNGKGRGVITASSAETVRSVALILAEKRIGAVVVVDSQGRIEGIASERDFVRAIAFEGAAALDRPIGELMTKNVRTCSPEDTESELMALMTEHRIRHIPVLDDGKLAGIISIGDVVKFRIEAIEREAEEMKTYISSAG